MSRASCSAARMLSRPSSAFSTAAGGGTAAPEARSMLAAHSILALDEVVPGLVKRRIQHQRPLEARTGHVQVPERELGLSEPVERVRVVATDRECAREARRRAFVVSALPQEVAEIRMRFRQRGIELQARFGARSMARSGLPRRRKAIARWQRHAASRRSSSIARDSSSSAASQLAQLQSEDADGVQRVGVGRQRRLQRVECARGGPAISDLQRLERLRDQPAVVTHRVRPVAQPDAVSSHPSNGSASEVSPVRAAVTSPSGPEPWRGMR